MLTAPRGGLDLARSPAAVDRRGPGAATARPMAAKRHHERDDQGGDRAHQKSASAPPVSVTWRGGARVAGQVRGGRGRLPRHRARDGGVERAARELGAERDGDRGAALAMVALKSASVVTKSAPELEIGSSGHQIEPRRAGGVVEVDLVVGADVRYAHADRLARAVPARQHDAGAIVSVQVSRIQSPDSSRPAVAPPLPACTSVPRGGLSIDDRRRCARRLHAGVVRDDDADRVGAVGDLRTVARAACTARTCRGRTRTRLPPYWASNATEAMPEPVSLAVADIATFPVPEAGIDGVVVGGVLSTRRVIAAVCAVWPPVSVATARSCAVAVGERRGVEAHVRGVVAWKAQTSFHVAVPAARCWIFTSCSPRRRARRGRGER